MSEFDEQPNMWGKYDSPLSTQGQHLPDDFSEEDLAFAQELDTLFALHEEELPPYFVQTLLDAEGPHFRPVDHGFEYKTRARVFRRLKLRRRIFHSMRPPLRSLLGIMPARRSLAMCAALMLFMLFTVIFTAPSFASGMTILLHGAHAGVMLVKGYPTGVSNSTSPVKRKQTDTDAQPKISLQAAQRQLHDWKMYWPQALPNDYTLDDIYLYQEQEHSWADGPFIELDYSLTGAPSHGTGLLAIREFKLKPNINVLQVVKDGAAQGIKIDQSGRAQAIYVDGQWILRNKFNPVWVYGQRSELIYQKDGIVFWIVGDQRDGMDKDQLFKIATSLQVFHITHYIREGSEGSMNIVTLVTGDVNGPFTGDLLAVYPDDGSVGSYLSVVGSQDSLPGPELHSH